MEADAILRALWCDTDPLNWFRNVTSTLKVIVSTLVEIQATQQQTQAALQKNQLTLERILKAMADLQTSLDSIDKTTNLMGATLVEEGATLKTISDNQDALIAAIKAGTVTPAMIAQAEKSSATLDAVGSNLAAIAAISKDIAAKGAPAVVPPTPVPGPTPAPPPITP